MGRLPNHSIVAQLVRLNQQNRRLEAELLLYLGELDRRQIYREQAVASAFAFCVLRLGYSEDVAFKRVGAARLMRRFPLIYDLLVSGRIHLTALMLIKPHLMEENHEEWLLLACEKSKRQVERLVASRCPRPDVRASIRQLPGARHSPLEASPQWATTDHDGIGGAHGQSSAPTTQTTKAQPLSAQATAEQVAAAQVTASPTRLAPSEQVPGALRLAPAARVTPLSSKTYRVTFTASERLKQKLDRAGELLSHCIHPSDLPALVERALDQLLEREETRRYGARPPSNPQSVAPARRDSSPKDVRSSNPQSSEPGCGDSSPQGIRPSNSQLVELAVELEHESCPVVHSKPNEAKDPDLAPIGSRSSNAKPRHAPDPDPALDLIPVLDLARAERGASNASALASGHQTTIAAQRNATLKSRRRQRVPAAVRRAVFERDGGQCTFVDHEGRRCGRRHFLEFDHIEAHALGGPETVTNLRLRCAAHNALEAERLLGRERVKNAAKHANQKRAR